MSKRQICAISGEEFEIRDEDLAFYERIGVPPPKLSPTERMRRRYSFRNEFSLYSRNCDFSGKRIFSIYAEDAEFPVYSNPDWWSDAWDRAQYGREFDFSKTFAENYAPLFAEVPRPSLGVIYATMENSDFCNQAGHLKDCYLIVNADFSERCLYGKGVNRCYECLDCYKLYDSEACYETLNSYNCQFCTDLLDSSNCSDCHFGAYLIGCDNCFACVNLRNQRYCFFNEQLSEEDYKRRVAEMQAEQSREQIRERFDAFRAEFPVKWMQERNCENCVGDYLVNCKDCYYCFDNEELERSAYCSDLKRGQGISYANLDISYFGVGATECYDSLTIGHGANQLFFCQDIYGGHDQCYSMYCMNQSHHLFGCIGLTKQSYCILNAQYSEAEYTKLVDKIIAHMKETGEWGEFFPARFAAHAYNDSVAHEHFPLSKEQALALGYRWREPRAADYRESTYMIPESIEQVGDDILDAVLACEQTGRNYKLQNTELEFYRKMKLPIPRVCPQERHRRRIATRNSRFLHSRACSKTGEPLQTTVAPERAEPVYSASAYDELFR